MIKSFSDLEYREVNGQRKPLLEKKSDGTGVIRNKVTAISEDDGSGAALSRYGVYVKCDHGHYLKPDEI